MIFSILLSYIDIIINNTTKINNRKKTIHYSIFIHEYFQFKEMLNLNGVRDIVDNGCCFNDFIIISIYKMKFSH